MGSKSRYHSRRRLRRDNIARNARERVNIAQINRHNDLAANEVSDSESDHDGNQINAQNVVEYRFDSSDDDIPLAVLRVAGFAAPDVSIASSPAASPAA